MTRKLGLVAVFVALAAFVQYLLFLPASVYWLDSPEFMAAAGGLGLAHPPGHPTAVMLMKMFMSIPLGDMPFRANLFSAFFAAAAAGLTAGIAYVVAARRRTDAWAMLVAVCSGLMFAGCRSMFIQAMAAEVYTLNAALMLGALLVVMAGPLFGRRADDARGGMVAGVLTGLALANHHYLAILVLPALVAAFWVDRKSMRPFLMTVAACAVTTTAAYLYLPVRSAAGAWPIWTSVQGVGDFLWYASAAIFSQSLGSTQTVATAPDAMGNPALALVLIGGSLGPLVPVMALGGLYLLIRMFDRQFGLVLLLLLAGGFTSKVAMGILDPSNPDDHGYFLMALSALAILAPGVLLMPRQIGRLPRIVFGTLSVAAMVAMVGWAVAGGVAVGHERATFDHTRRIERMVWAAVPHDGVALVSHYPVYFLMQYGQEIEGVRPDVTLVQQSLYHKARGGRAYSKALALRDPDLGPLVTDFQQTGAISWPRIKDLAADRPVMIEASPDYDAPASDLEYAGWFFRVRDRVERADRRDRVDLDNRLDSLDRSAIGNFLPALRQGLWTAARANVETRRVVIRNLAASSEWLARETGDELDAAAELLQYALDLNPDDRTVKSRLANIRKRANPDDK